MGMALLVLSTSWAPAQTVQPNEPTWRIDLGQGRMSAVLSGDVLEDERQLTHADTDATRSWARNHLSLHWRLDPAAASGLEWGSYLVQEAHVRGVGAQAGVRMNQSTGIEGARYPFAVDSVQHRRWGFNARYHGSTPVARLDRVRWHVGANLLAVDRFKSMGAEGVLTDGAGGTLALQATRRSDELGGTSTFISPDKALGWGVTLDLGIEGGAAGQTQWALSVRDLGPRVRLRHVLGNDQTLDTDTVSFDADGYVNFAPAISGRYSDRQAWLRIEPEWTASLAHPLGRAGRGLAGLVWHGARQELSVGYEHRLAEHRLSVIGYALRDMPFSVGLRWDMPYGSLGWRGDRLSAGKARIWMLEGGLRF